MTIENISLSNLRERMLPTQQGSNPQPADHQLDGHPTELSKLACCCYDWYLKGSTLSILGKIFIRQHFEIFFLRDNLNEISNLFSGKNKKKSILNLLSADIAQRVVKVKIPLHEAVDFVVSQETICMKYQCIFSRIKKRKNIIHLSSAEIAQSKVKVNLCPAE